MRKAINEKDLEFVAGGAYFINNQNKLYFQTLPDAEYQLTSVSRYQAQAIMDGLIGKYATEAEYDQACITALRSEGLIS